MRKFFQKHQEWLFIGLTVLFTAVLALYFFWGIAVLVVKVNDALAPEIPDEDGVRFDIEGARAVLQSKENSDILESAPIE